MSLLNASYDVRPRRLPDVEVRRRRDDGTHILCRGGRYVALSERSLEIWNLLDGTVDLRELSARYSQTGVDTMPALVALTRTLVDCGFATVDALASPESGKSKKQVAAMSLLEGYATFAPQRIIDTTYRMARPAFHPAIFAGAALIAVTGFVAFLLAQHRASFEASFLGILFLGVAICVSICAHEAAHALTLRHFGGVVLRAGVGWYWFTPTAFVDTSDAHFLTRGKRIAVCLAGPAIDALVAGAAGLVSVFAHDANVAAWGLALASLTYVGLLSNLNPLLETDWYYALTDLLGRPNLRRDGFAQILGRGPTGDRIGLIYGVAAIMYAAMFVVLAVPAIVRATLAVWLAPIVAPQVIAVLPFGAAIVAALSIGLSAVTTEVFTDFWKTRQT